MHLTVYYTKDLAYKANHFYCSLFECTSRKKKCFTCLKIAKSAQQINCQRPLAAGFKVFGGTAQRSMQVRGILVTTVLIKLYLAHLDRWLARWLRFERICMMPVSQNKSGGRTNVIVALILKKHKDFPAKIQIYQAGIRFNCLAHHRVFGETKSSALLNTLEVGETERDVKR
jgi:hypothetical protein